MHHFRYNTPFVFLFTTLAIFLFGCSKQAEWRQADGAVWGTTYHIVYEGEADLTDSIVAVMGRVEKAVSMFDPASNVSRINAGQTDTVCDMMADLLVKSKKINTLSGGHFDPTVMPLVNLWGFGPDGKSTSQPDSATVRKALGSVGIQDCTVDANRTLRRKHRDTKFDFSAIAKGYGVDCVAEMLEKNGCANYMVEIGGEVRVKGHNPRGTDWRLQIDDPVASGADGHAPLAIVQLTDCGLATSGNYRNFHTLPDGTRVAHTISPLTGYPVQTSTLSVSVVAGDCVTADALATACMAMPLDQAKAMIEGLGNVSAIFVTDDGHGQTRTQIVGPDIFVRK